MNSDKKPTQWITIPEEDQHSAVHTSGHPDQVKNKWLWGVGFVVVVIISFAVLMPGQFSGLFQGNLFDAEGLSEEDMKINLLPTNNNADAGVVSIVDNAGDATENNANSNNDLIQPSADPVTIAIDPIKPKDCGSSLDCFAQSLSNCALSTAKVDYQIEGQNLSADLNLNSAIEGSCIVEVSISQAADTSLIGTKSTCEVPQSSYTADQVTTLLSDQAQFNQQCRGDISFKLSNYLADVKSQQESDTKQQLIDDLTSQIESLNQQIASQQNTGLRGAAADVGVASNLAIGNPSAQNPGFRANPYRVTLTPQQILQQNQAQGLVANAGAVNVGQSVVSANQINSNLAANATYQNLSGGTTPETGPAETLLVALVLTYIGLSGFKYLRHLKRS